MKKLGDGFIRQCPISMFYFRHDTIVTQNVAKNTRAINIMAEKKKNKKQKNEKEKGKKKVEL